MKPPIISVNFYDSLRRGAFQFYQRVTPDSYTHSVSAFGGYDSATITLGMTQTEAEDWLESGLMRHVKVYASALDVIWEGFVNEIRLNLGPLAMTYGPLLNMANRVLTTFTPLEEGNEYFVYGSQAFTDYENNTTSQDQFGIMPVVLNGGSQTLANAEIIRDTHLANNVWPQLTQSWTSQGRQAATVTLICKGYYHLLNYPYVGIIGTQDASVKLAAVLAYTPNSSWLTYDDANVEANTLQIPIEEPQLRTGLSTIKDIVVRGDASYNRWLFYILNDRKAYYHQAPTTIEYRAYVQQGGVILQSPNQSAIDPWRLRPGRWLAFYDFLVGRNITAVNRDPRMMFVEKVTYRAPFGLQLAGGNTDEINQLLAQSGMGGIS